jgi:hypothetical protein
MDVCKEKLALMDEYNKATVNYSKAVSLQFSKMGLSINARHSCRHRADNLLSRWMGRCASSCDLSGEVVDKKVDRRRGKRRSCYRKITALRDDPRRNREKW